MKFSLTQIFVVISSIQALIVPGASCLPTAQPTDIEPIGPLAATESPNPAIEARSILQKRDSWDCKGSSSCGLVPQWACRSALSYFATNEVFWGEKRAWVNYDSVGYGHCLAMWKCDNPADYVSAAQAGVSQGHNLRTKAFTIYHKKSEGGGGCTRCGSVWFWGSCRFTFNYCQNNCAGR
ncbi:hypothetical protein TWF730_003256 [Orbilia blumenaviensis]|uniref:Uncharacterized protein n=1 Tax=Orbilia blumenaviensis TaxID=1796055 RepID=A0AAV9U962_9PEZI